MIEAVVLVAGGTGGHIFPAQAVAAELVKEGYKVVFITDKTGKQLDGLPATVQVMTLPLFRRRNTFSGMVKFAWGLVSSFYHAWRGLKFIKPSVVVGFGGYPSFSPVLAAQYLGIKTIVHEQNAVMGQVNRVLGRKANTIAVSFKATQQLPQKANVVITGNPVRPDFQTFSDVVYAAPEGDAPIKILVTGGSQGASIFSNLLPEVFSKLVRLIDQPLIVTHQCPNKDVEALTYAYEKAGLSNVKVTSFIKNMAEEMSSSHLIISRSGASTLAEVAILGKPTLFVPFKLAKDNHQYYNAKIFTDNDAGWLITETDFSLQTVLDLLQQLLRSKNQLQTASKNAKALSQPTAVHNIVNLIQSTTQKD